MIYFFACLLILFFLSFFLSFFFYTSLLLFSFSVIRNAMPKILGEYWLADPRCGLKMKQLLGRLGWPEFGDMFPNRVRYFEKAQAAHYSIDKLKDLFKQYAARAKKEADRRGIAEKQYGRVSTEEALPHDLFFNMLSDALAHPPAHKPGGPSRPLPKPVADLSSLPYAYTIAEFRSKFATAFTRVFGAALVSRQSNLCNQIVNALWGKHTFKNSVVNVLSPVTWSQVRVAFFKSSQNGADITAFHKRVSELLSPLGNAVSLPIEPAMLRINTALEFTQEAVDRLCLLVNRAPLLQLISVPLSEAGQYNARFNFLRQLKSRTLTPLLGNADRKPAPTAPGNSTPQNDSLLPARRTSLLREPLSVAAHADETAEDAAIKKTSSGDEARQRGGVELLVGGASPEEQEGRLMTTFESVSVPFVGGDAEAKLEVSTSYLHLLQTLLEKIAWINRSMQAIKLIFRAKRERRRLRKVKIDAFCQAARLGYLADREKNLVRTVWLHERKVEQVARRFQAVLQEARDARDACLNELAFLPQHGWAAELDEQGYTFYYDRLGRGLEATYEMPQYDYRQYRANQAIQRTVRKFLVACLAHRRYKATLKEDKLKEMRETQLLAYQNASRLFTLRVRYLQHSLSHTHTHIYIYMYIIIYI
jgi:hypothetical protein